MISRKLASALVLVTILSAAPSASAASAPTSYNSNHYIVQKGDSLWKIAQKFNTSVDTLVKVNNLKNSNYILVGQDLLITKTSKTIAKTTKVKEKAAVVKKEINTIKSSNFFNTFFQKTEKN